MMMVSVFLPLLLMQLIVHVTSTLLSVQVMSYKNLMNEANGPALCALDLVNKTMSSSSLEHCSLSCTRDDTCTGFNIKNLTTCDIYNYSPRLVEPVTDCVFYQVGYCLNLILTVTGDCKLK